MPRSRSARMADSKEAAERAEEADRQRRVEVVFLEKVRARLPDQWDVVEALGCLYTELGRYEEGLEIDREMVRLQPRMPTPWYNLACSLALTGQTDEALDALARAIDLGYADAAWMRKDEDLVGIRKDPRFAILLARLLSRSSKPKA